MSSPLQNPRHSIDRSPRSVDSKPVADRRSPKTATTPDKQQRALKGSDLQAKLTLAQEDLKKATEQLALIEKEKDEAFEELKEAKRLADEANEKLREALVSQKKAEESSEIEKFRADELEQVGIEAAQKREEEWQKELEAIRNQHAVDVAALLSTTQELQRANQELSITSDAKDTALGHADDAVKIAEMNATKVEILSAELDSLKELLDSELEIQSNEAAEFVKKLNSDVDLLKQELERAKAAEERLPNTEALVEVLRIEVINAKQNAADAHNLVDEWRNKVELLEIKVLEATKSERSASDSLHLMMKQLEESNILLQDADSDITSLKGEIDSLEISLRRHKVDRKELDRRLEMSRLESIEIEKTIENLKSEIQRTKEEKMRAMDNEMLAAMNVQSLLEEKNKLINKLEASRDVEDESKRAIKKLSSALQEVSKEMRDVEEKISANQVELGNAESQIEDLNIVLRATVENYEAVLNEEKEEIGRLEKLAEKSQLAVKMSKAELDEKEVENTIAMRRQEEQIAAVKTDMDKLSEDMKTEWGEKEFGFLNAIKVSEEEIAAIKRETHRLVDLLKDAEEEARNVKEDGSQLLRRLKEVESETSTAKEEVEKANAENLQLEEMLLDKENKLQSLTKENIDFRTREAIALQKVDELSKLLEEALAKKTKENGELSSSENDYDLLPKVVKHLEEDAEREELEKHPSEESSREDQSVDMSPVRVKFENGNGNAKEGCIEVKMSNGCKVFEKDSYPKMDQQLESFEDELDSKTEDDGFDQINGLSSETAENGGSPPSKQQQQKKKKALLHKFSNLLKKKNNLK